jgi:hypothetical protein
MGNRWDDFFRLLGNNYAQEGRHGYWKEHLELESRMRVKGKIKVDQYLTRNLSWRIGIKIEKIV